MFPKKGRLFETDAIIKSIRLTIEILLMQYENINNASAMQRCSGFNWFCPILSEDHTIHYTKSWPEKDPASCDVIITRPVALCGKSTKSILWVKKDSSYFIIRHMPDKTNQNKWKASFFKIPYIYIVCKFSLYTLWQKS